MIKAVIFDCFGVLTADLWLQFKDKYFAGDPIRAEQATNLNKQTDRGLISYDEFVEKISALARAPIAKISLLPGRNAPNELLFQYIKEQLKPKYKIGLLSNAADNWLNELFLPEQLILFDAVVLSYEVGVIKPDPKIYQLMAQKLDVSPSECIVVDDREAYCTACRPVGMQAVWYQDGFSKFKTDLEQILSHT